MVALPADAMSPPLVRTLVSAEKIRGLDLILESDFMALGCIEESEPAEVEQAWPALSIGAGDAGDGKSLIGIGSKIALKQAEGIGRFDVDGFTESGGCHVTNCGSRGMTGPDTRACSEVLE